MKFVLKFRLALLWCFMLGMALHARGLVAETVPPMGTFYQLVRFTNGTCMLQNLPQEEVELLKKQKNVQSVQIVSYTDIVTTVTQRLYDYQFYFSQLINTKPNTPAFTAGLARLMETFSQNFTTWSTITNAAGGVTGWAATEALYANALATGYFEAWQDDQFTNGRVIPVLNNTQYQVLISGTDVEYGNINSPYCPPGAFQDIFVIGHATYTMTYEQDNAWRFMSFNVDLRELWINPPSVWPQTWWLPYPESPVTSLPKDVKPPFVN